MRLRYTRVLPLCVTTLLASLGGCPYQLIPALYLTEANNGAEVTRAVGQTLTISLPTYYRQTDWQIDEAPDPAMLELAQDRVIPWSLFTPSRETFEFVARGAGTTTIRLGHYSDVTEVPSPETYTVTVTVVAVGTE